MQEILSQEIKRWMKKSEKVSRHLEKEDDTLWEDCLKMARKIT